MKKRIIFTCLVGSAILILDSLHAGQLLIQFILTGVLPGTSIALSASFMLAIYALVGGFFFSRLFSLKRNDTFGPEL